MNLDSLKQEFDLVKIKHYNTPDYRATHVALVKGLNVYIGIARCVVEDPFNRRTGRLIALGRAYHEYEVAEHKIQTRGFKKWSYVKFAENKDQLEEILCTEVYNGPVKDPIASPEACNCDDCLEEGLAVPTTCHECRDCHCKD